MTSALQGCMSRSQLEVAYKILHKHLLVAQQTIIKYEAQYRQAETPLSQVSTALDIYNDFDNIDSVDDRMRFMLDNVPHHQSQVLPAAREALKNGLGWDVAFPTLPLPSSSSQLPPSDLPHSQDTKGKKKVYWDDTMPWENTSASVEQGRDLDDGLEPSFGFQTPFKKGTRFFNTSADGLSSAYFSTPGPISTPDVTIGLATPSRTELGDNVRELSVNQGANTLTITNRTSNFAQTTTTATTSKPLVKNNDSFATTNSNNTPPTSPNRGGRNDPPRGSGNSPPPPGGGGGGPPNQGSSGGGAGGGGNGGSNPPSWPSQFDSSPHGGGGGGGGGDPGGGGGPTPQSNEFGPPAPYGNIPASIKTELKVEQLPEWDRNHWTAIDYFWQIQQLAYLGGWLPEALGYWLWFRLKEGSSVRRWFVTLPITHQSFM